MLNDIYFSYQSYLCEHSCKIYTEVEKKMLSGEEYSGQYGHILLLYFYTSCNKIQRKVF